MVKEWVTISVIAFGVIIAVIGVVAYLRMYKKIAWTSSPPPEQPQQTIETVNDSTARPESGQAPLKDEHNTP
ncbi:hypothetical protein ACFOLF_15120 [Paenibacillus sepulcri]|uniref:Uncharacterized protein n=1 Tax=Paenibacillus sepulcri TaxID=359917 RepID=A0ABS7C0V1_9BACL|nr:hypothetical protein [Paenibacillus sepulcri]